MPPGLASCPSTIHKLLDLAAAPLSNSKITMPGLSRNHRAQHKTVDEEDILPLVQNLSVLAFLLQLFCCHLTSVLASDISSSYSTYSDELTPLGSFKILPNCQGSRTV